MKLVVIFLNNEIVAFISKKMAQHLFRTTTKAGTILYKYGFYIHTTFYVEFLIISS